MSSRLHCLTVLAALLIFRVGSAADNRQVPISQRGVDRLSSSRGPDLLGAVLRKTPRGDVVMAVRREWLQGSDAARLKRMDEARAASSTRIWRRLIERIDAWKTALKPDDPLLVSLSLERTRVVNQLKAVEASGRVPATRFVLISVPATDVSSLTIQVPAHKQIALVAWVEELDDVETRSARDLAAELAKMGIDPATASAESLWRDVPAVEDDKPTWLVRRALKTIQLVEPLHFQGTGGLLVAVNGKKPGRGLDQPIDSKVIGDLLGQVLGGNLGGNLGKLLDQLGGRPGGAKPGGVGLDPLLPAVRRAESAGRDAFRVTRFRHDVAGRRTMVQSEFLVQLDRGEWAVVWQASETIMVRARPEARKRIERDPRVQGLLKLVKGLGLDGGDQAIETALQFGAATQEGQERIDAGFLRFRDRYSHRLDGPPLWWGRTIRTGEDGKP